MTDFSDACFGCGGHLRANVHSGVLCPECEKRRDMDAFGRLTECHPDPFGKVMIVNDIGDAMDRLVDLSSRGAALPNKRAASNS